MMAGWFTAVILLTPTMNLKKMKMNLHLLILKMMFQMKQRELLMRNDSKDLGKSMTVFDRNE